MHSLKILAVLLFLAGCVAGSQAAFEKNSGGPRSAGLGGAGVALAGDVWCADRNPALPTEKSPLIGLAWQRLFDLPEMSHLQLSGNFDISDFAAGAGIDQFGGKLYRETSLMVSVARSFSRVLSAGAQVSLNQVAIQHYGDAAAVGAVLGLCCRPIPELTAAAVWRNFPRSELGRWNSQMPEALHLGLALRLPRGSFVLDIVEESRFATEYRFGAEALVFPQLTFRVGSSFEPVRPSVGFTVNVWRWNFHYAGDLHPDLGPSHSLGLEVTAW